MSTNVKETEMTERTYTREDMARAWENGHSWGWDDARTKARAERDADIIGPRMTWRLLTPNPYEEGVEVRIYSDFGAHQDDTPREERETCAEARLALHRPVTVDDLGDAAIERMARALYLERLGGYSELTWETEPEDVREMYSQEARAALEALINQEEA